MILELPADRRNGQLASYVVLEIRAPQFLAAREVSNRASRYGSEQIVLIGERQEDVVTSAIARE